MRKTMHEVRDAIHGFIQFDTTEKQVIDSAPFQRLRNIHQLAMCYQVYPGATHARFEHSIGVMDVAARIFDAIFDGPIAGDVQPRIADRLEPAQKVYWRRVLRLAALLHDVGHLPFSHAAEKELLPAGWSHERLTAEMIRHSEIGNILRGSDIPIDPEHVIDVAWETSDRNDGAIVAPWQRMLNEIITGKTFGADRIDYLLRDSLHAGVAYGKFDPRRLINNIRPIIDPVTDEITLAISRQSIHAAEALLLARYFMYNQVYLHRVRRIYDIHLKDFLIAWLPDGRFSVEWERLLTLSDCEVTADMRRAARDYSHPLHELAARLVNRKHFRTVYELTAAHKNQRSSIMDDLTQWAQTQWGAANVRRDDYKSNRENNDFHVTSDDGSVASSLDVSGIIANIPSIEIGFLFINPDCGPDVKAQLDARASELLRQNVTTSLF